MPECELLSVSKVSEILGISRTSVYSLLNSKKLKAVKLMRRTMIKASDLKEFLEECEEYDGAYCGL